MTALRKKVPWCPAPAAPRTGLLRALLSSKRCLAPPGTGASLDQLRSFSRSWSWNVEDGTAERTGQQLRPGRGCGADAGAGGGVPRPPYRRRAAVREGTVPGHCQLRPAGERTEAAGGCRGGGGGVRDLGGLAWPRSSGGAQRASCAGSLPSEAKVLAPQRASSAQQGLRPQPGLPVSHGGQLLPVPRVPRVAVFRCILCSKRQEAGGPPGSHRPRHSPLCTPPPHTHTLRPPTPLIPSNTATAHRAAQRPAAQGS